MNERLREPVRFRDRRGDADGPDARAAALTEAARESQAPDAAAFARIRSAVHARSAAARRTSFARLPVRRVVVFAATFAVVALTAASAARALWSRYVRPRVLVSERLVAPAPAARRPSRAPARTAAEPAAAAPAPLDAVPAAARPPVLPEPERAATANRRAAPAPLSEAATLARALSELRQHKDPGAALALLDLHDRRFPRGVLQPEALRARAEALVASGDLDGALALLDGQASLGDGLGSDLLLARAELRAAKARYRDAVADFDALLARDRGAPPTDTERALYGRAVCLGHLGKDLQARADLREYQRRFPGGKFAVEAARLLGRGGPGQP